MELEPGTISWIRVASSFPWWPCLIVDERYLIDSVKIEYATKHKGKRIPFYYFATNQYGYAVPSQCKLYSDECNNELKTKQKITKSHVNDFNTSISIADTQLAMDTASRLRLVLDAIKPQEDTESEGSKGEEDSDDKVKRKQTKKQRSNTTKEDIQVIDSELDHVLNVDNSDTDDKYDDDSSFDDHASKKPVSTSVSGKEKTGTKRRKVQKDRDKEGTDEVITAKKAKRVTGSHTSSGKSSSSNSSMNSDKVKKQEVERSEKERVDMMKQNSSVPVWQQAIAMNTETKSSAAAADSKKLKTIEKYVYLLLKYTDEPGIEDADKAVSILKKLEAMQLTITEVKIKDAGKVVNRLRSHSNRAIAAAANLLKDQWLLLLTTSTKASYTSSSSSKIRPSNGSSSSSITSTTKVSLSIGIKSFLSKAPSMSTMQLPSTDVSATISATNTITTSTSSASTRINTGSTGIGNKNSSAAVAAVLVDPIAASAVATPDVTLYMQDEFNISKLDAAAYTNTARVRALRMLHTTFLSMPASIRLETAIDKAYNIKSSLSLKYVSCVNRLTFLLLDPSCAKLRHVLMCKDDVPHSLVERVIHASGRDDLLGLH